MAIFLAAAATVFIARFPCSTTAATTTTNANNYNYNASNEKAITTVSITF